MNTPSQLAGPAGTGLGCHPATDLLRSLPLLAEAGIHQLRRAQRADCDHARGAGGEETLDQRGAVPPRAVWFGLHVLFPSGMSVDWFAVMITVVAFAGMVRWKWDVIPVVAGAGTSGLIDKMLL